MSPPIPPVSTLYPALRPQLLGSTTPSSIRPGAERIPIMAVGHTGRASGVGGATAQKEGMNCKSCRKKKIKCNRLQPTCGACLAFRCACIYDAIPKKRGPKTEVLEELLKRVSGLERRLAEEKEANMAGKQGDIKAGNGSSPATESAAGQDQKQQPTSPKLAEIRNIGNGEEDSEIDSKAGYERSDAHGAPRVGLQTTGTRGSDYDSEPPPYSSLSPALGGAGAVAGSDKPPITIIGAPLPAMKRGRTSDTETPPKALEATGVKRTRTTTSPIHPDSAQNTIHCPKFHDSYINTFFHEFHGKPYEILHEETFRASVARGTVHPSQLHIVCAIGAKFAHPGPHGHSLCVQFTEAARGAVDMDFPSLENFQTVLLITISNFYLGKGFKTFMLLGIAVGMAYGLDLNRELPPDDPATPLEREIRRRSFWTCYLLDRFAVCGSRRPPMLLEESILLKLPSSMPQMRSLDEEFFSSHIAFGSGAGQSHAGGLLAPRRQAETASALCIDITRLLGTTVKYIEQGGVKGDIYFPWHAQSNLTKIRRELDHWAARTSELYSQTPGATRGDGLYLRHPDVTLLVMAKAIFHLVSCLIYRPFLAVEFGGSLRKTHQGVPLHVSEVGHGGQQQIWQAEATKMCFVHANALGDLVEVLKSTMPKGFKWPAILGYCVVTAATIHLHGMYYQNTEHDPVLRTSKGYFNLEMQHIRYFCDNWPAARVQYVMLNRLKQAHEKLVQCFAVTGSSHIENNFGGIAVGLGYSSGAGYWAGYTGKQNVFQLDDFFRRYSGGEKYFDGAQCPFVEDMTEAAAKLSLNDELGGPDVSRAQTQTQDTISGIPGGLAGAATPHAFTAEGGDDRSVPEDIKHEKQYDCAQTYLTSNPHQKERAWDLDRQKGQENALFLPSDTSAGAFNYLQAVEAQTPSSPTASTSTMLPTGQSRVNTARSAPVARDFDVNVETDFLEGYGISGWYPVDDSPAAPQVASYSPSDPSLTPIRRTHGNPLTNQETLHSAELINLSWIGDDSAPLGTYQDLNTRTSGLGVPQSVSVHQNSENPNLPQSGDMHTNGYTVQGGIYIDHSSPAAPMQIPGNPPDENNICEGGFGGCGAQLHTEYVEQPDPFLLVLTQMAEERNTSYLGLSQHTSVHPDPGGEQMQRMRMAAGSEMNNTEVGILHTSRHIQPMETEPHFGSQAQVDSMRLTAVNMGMGVVTDGYSNSWMQPGAHFSTEAQSIYNLDPI